MRHALLVAVAVAAGCGSTWHEGPHGKNRVVHVSVAAGATAVALAGELTEEALAPEECRPCEPNAFDRAARSALRWDATSTAANLSDVTAFAATPVVAAALVLPHTFEDPSLARVIDDVVPVVESVAITSILTRAVKYAVARQRPSAYFDAPMDEEDNLAFPSGHASIAFAIATGAGRVARMRGYRSEAWIWIAGLSLATTTGYLRIAADRHYATDVLAGAALGSAVGLTIPLLMRRETAVVATANGVAIAGVW